MGFLARYWNMVEKAVSETGSNPGDIRIDLKAMFKNTEQDNTVVSPTNNNSTTPNHPQQDGDMSRYAFDFDAREARARRAARRSQTCEELEERAYTETTRRDRDLDNSRTGETQSPSGQIKDSEEALPKHRTLTMECGGGYKVNVVLDGVVVDGAPTW